MRSARRSGQAIFVGILVATCLGAAGFGAWSLVVEARTDAAVAGAVILLALAQLSAILSRLALEDRHSRSSRDMVQVSADMDRQMRVMQRRMDTIEDRQNNAQDDVAGRLGEQIAALERTVAGLAARLEANAAPALRESGAATNGPVAPQVAANDSGSEELSVFLAPIVRLSSGQTSYYRASFTGGGPDGEIKFIARVVGVLRHLDRRGRAIGIFCPLPASAFGDARFLHQLVEFLRRSHDVAGKLVIEISQADLARLTQPGMRGLAWLAQLGAIFSLAAASVEGPDLAALRELGFQFVDLDVKALPEERRDRLDAITAFAAEAERHELTVMAGPIADGADLAWLQRGASLGHGPHFARPRRVRSDFGEGEEPHAAAA